jgi:uncharacterized protein YjdB
MRRISLLLWSCIFAVAFLMNSCDSDSRSGSAPGITTQPVNATVSVGQTATFTVVAFGSSPISYQWQKNMANISGATGASYTTPATVNADNGAQFDVIVTNAKGSITSAAATLTVKAALQSIAVTPASPSIKAGTTQQFKATGTYSDNSTNDITTAVIWNSTNAAAATIGASTGLATGVAAGTTQITATQGAVVSPNDALTVTAAPTLQSIAVTPASPSIAAGATQQFKATGTYSDSSTKDITTTVTWNSSNAAAATIGASTGLATGVAAGTTQITAMLGAVVSPNDALTVTAAAPTLQSIAVTPASPSIKAGATQQFKATGTYSDSSTKDITTTAAWNSTNAAAATIGASTGLATGVAAGTTQITATQGAVVSPADTLTVTAATSSPSDSVTYHYDNSRSGANTNETILTTANVKSASFGKLGELTVDSRIDGQVLYLNQVAIPGTGTKNVVYFATENDSIYAVDADSFTGTNATVLWKTSLLKPGETPPTQVQLGCGNVDPVGVMSTPVIDRAKNAIYAVALSKDSGANYFYRIHALDLTTGAELFGGPTNIAATYPGTGGNSSGGTVTFLPKIHEQRAALLESGGKIYIGFSGYYGDCGQYSGWLLAYDAATLQQFSVIDIVPGNFGAGMWMSGSGPASDSAGYVYTVTGNGFNPNTDIPGVGGNYPNSFIKLSTAAGLLVSDYFAPFNTVLEDNGDVDLGSAGPLLLPDLVDAGNVTRHLAIAAGKDGNLYVIDRDNLGHYNATQNSNYQTFHIATAENFSSAIYFNGTVYIGPGVGGIAAYKFSQAKLPTTPTQTTFNQDCAGTTPSISANGTSNAILWCVDFRIPVLRAFDATNLSNELYNSAQASGNRDKFASIPAHFITPMVANGKVYFGTGSTVAAFGLLP